MSIESEEVLIHAINHKIRREILELLEDGPKSYTTILNNFGVSTGKLGYHLNLLEGLVEKNIDGNYVLTSLGRRAYAVLEDLRSQITEKEKPLIRKAFLSQKDKEQSFLHLMFNARMQFKFYLLILTGLLLVISSIMFIATSDSPWIIAPMLVLGIAVMIGGIIWIQKIKKSAPDFIDKVEKILDKED